MSAGIIASSRSLLSAAGFAGTHRDARKPGNQQLVTQTDYRLVTYEQLLVNAFTTSLYTGGSSFPIPKLSIASGCIALFSLAN
jgi:hypothetical protein